MRSNQVGTGLFVSAVSIAVAAMSASTVSAAPFEKVIFVEFDYETMHHTHDQTAHVWHFDENGDFVQFPNRPGNPKASEFTFTDIVPGLNANNPIWFRGVSEMRILTGIPSATSESDDVTQEPDYSEMNHHFVMGVESDIRNPIDPCKRIWPIVAGSELSRYELPQSYGMRFKGSDRLFSAAWHWANPGGIEGENVFLALTLELDTANANAFTDVNVSYISVDYCDYSFCLNVGPQYLSGPEASFRRQNVRLVAGVPHMHDHGQAMQLNHLQPNDNVNVLVEAVPQNDQDYEAAHHCHGLPMEEMIMPHTHDGNDTGHLPVRGLEASVWMPGSGGPIIPRGDKVYVSADFLIPFHTDDPELPEAQVDNMAIWILFWEVL